jgi:acetate kinase
MPALDDAERVLILNAGSSSLKWSLLDAASATRHGQGTIEWNPAQAAAAFTPLLVDLQHVVAVGHRVVHGGHEFAAPIRITPHVVAKLSRLVEIDPLHTPPALAGIAAVTAAAPQLLQVAAFDTAFHRTLPAAAATFAVPWEWSERWHLRRYGFHGLSVEYAVRRAAEILGEHPRRMIVAHLGGGCSLTAIADGKSVDTTMGFTPLDGVMMATRPGALDPGLMLFLRRHGGMSTQELEYALEHGSGLAGVAGTSGDLRAILTAADGGHHRAELALAMFEHSLRRAVGAMAAVLEGIDALVFTGGIGENSPEIRASVCDTLRHAGLELDPVANGTSDSPDPDHELSTPRSVVRVLRIAAREDLSILEAVRQVRAKGED